jgi:F-type H+-transporting ATPase subunit delta
LSGAVASRYAAALADVALEHKDAERVKRDLEAFVSAFFESGNLRTILETPSVEVDAKRRVIEALAERMDLTRSVRNFIFLLVDHGRTEMLREIEQAFRAEMNARLGIAEAEVTSARKLSSEERQQLTAVLERRTKKKIEAHFREDGSLIGGAVVRVGSTVYDGSVREQLTRMLEQLEGE